MNDVWQRLRAIALTDVGRAITVRLRADKAARLGGGEPEPTIAQAVGAYLAAPLPVTAPAVPVPAGFASPPDPTWSVPPVTVARRLEPPVAVPVAVPAWAAGPPSPPSAPVAEPSDPTPASVPAAREVHHHRQAAAAREPVGTTTVSLVFADGAEVELAPDDPRVRPFRTAVSLLVDG